MATPATINEINGAYPSIDVSGAGTPASPWDLSLNANGSAEVADRVDGDYVAFTPVWTNVTVGDATNTGHYRYENGNIHVWVTFVFGSTTSFTGTINFTIPNGETGHASIRSLGTLNAKDGPFDETGHVANSVGGTTIHCYAGGNDIDATSPFTWVATDDIQLDIVVAL